LSRRVSFCFLTENRVQGFRYRNGDFQDFCEVYGPKAAGNEKQQEATTQMTNQAILHLINAKRDYINLALNHMTIFYLLPNNNLA
jgi:hypothetical protein